MLWVFRAADEKLGLLMLDLVMARIHCGSVQSNMEFHYSEHDPWISSSSSC